jgi:NDP-4-keto-2,6-dideoxyhexose 3-C-methyltransferase
MVQHLRTVGSIAELFGKPQPGDMVVDIGSNDGTLLKTYNDSFRKIGIDPGGEGFRKHYTNEIELVSDFFPSKLLEAAMDGRKAKIITSIAMFYDLEDPMQFMREVYGLLEENGIWILEQAYLPLMLSQLAYDGICHEHLAYYGLRQIKWMMDRVGFQIIGVSTNNVNGGSFMVIAKKGQGKHDPSAEKYLDAELVDGLDGMEVYHNFAKRVASHRDTIREFFVESRKLGRRVLGYGASTKGNVLLQYCGIGKEELEAICDVNADKHGCVTPGTHIPIVSDERSRRMKPSHFFVLPWHFRYDILSREDRWRKENVKFVFPLPSLEIV